MNNLKSSVKIRTLQDAFYLGGEEFRKYCLRYGKIFSMTDSKDDQARPIREYQIMMDCYFCTIKMVRGNVVSYSMN